MPHKVTVKIANDRPAPMRLWIEPWAEEFVIEPATDLSVEFEGAQTGDIDVVYVEGGLQVYGFRGSRAVVIKGTDIIWTAHARLAT